MNHFVKKCGAFFAAGIAAFLVIGGKADAMEDTYRTPFLSGPVRTWIYQGETFDSSRTRVFADDQEDGDLTAKIQKSGSVDTSKAGNYQISWKVTDSDGRTARMVTEVKVLDRGTASEEDKKVQRILYTLPDASHLTNIGFNRGYYHDRQSLGFWIPGGTELKIRLANSEEFTDSLKLKFMNDDSATETMTIISQKEDAGETVLEESEPVSTVYIPGDGEWVTVRNCFVQEDGTKGSADSVPFIMTPKNSTVQPVIEIAWNDGFQNIPYYRYGDDQDDFFRSWDESQAPFAIIEGDAATFLIPVVDRNRIINNPSVKEAYQFKSIDKMLEWYAAFVKQYDAYSGLDFHAEEVYNQNVRAKFFIKVNNSGIGAAYYTTDHSANNGQYSGGSLGGYLTKDWVSLHEFGHGYEGSIAWQEHPFVETTNNIMGYYFEPTYRPDSDFGWLLYDFYQYDTKEERYAALGKRAEDRRNETSTFAGIVEGAQHYNVSLFMFTNVLDKMGAQQTVADMHTSYRRYAYENGKAPSSSDIIAESFSRTGGYNVLPYFEGWHICPSEKIENEIYDLDLPMVYYLKNLIGEDEACEAVRKKLGLDGIYSLVSTDDLESTGYTSKVKLELDIDDFSQIQNKKLLIKNGSKVVKEVLLTAESMTLELPVGIYEAELPAPRTDAYCYGNEYIVASKGTSEKTFRYEKTKNPLVNDMQIKFLGIGDNLFATISVDTDRNILVWSVNKSEPHYIFSDTYASIRILSPEGKVIYSQSLAGDKTTEEAREEVSFPEGSKLEIYHREASGRLKFVSSYTGKELEGYTPTENDATVSYVMTDKGLMQENWNTDMRTRVYLDVLASYSESMLEEMTQEDLYRTDKFHNQKVTIAKAFELLDEKSQAEYIEKYGILVGERTETFAEYYQIDSEILTGMADSEQGQDEAAGSALDGNINTIWHSNYGGDDSLWPDIGAGINNSYTILMDKNRDIGRLDYVPRQDGGSNGRILAYRLSYSETENGDDFREISVSNPTWENNSKVKTVEFYAPNARRIRITALSTGGNTPDTHISAAEFLVYEKIMISTAETYVSDFYLETSGGVVQKDKNIEGKEISLFVNGKTKTFAKGLGVAAGASAVLDLSGKDFEIFSAMAGIDTTYTGAGEAVLEIYGDGKLLYQSETLAAGSPAEPVYLDIRGIGRLEIKVVGISGNTGVSLGEAGLRSSRDLTEITLKIGESAAVAANTSLIPSDRRLIWESSDETVAVVNENGVVTAAGEGDAVVSGISKTETITCKVHVTKAPSVQQNGSETNTGIKHPTGSQPDNGGTSNEEKITKPKKTVLKKVKPGKRLAVISWKKTAKADGYEVWMRTGKGAFKKVKTVKAKKLSVKIKKLKKGKKYTFKVRAYRKGTSNKKVYGAFSKKKAVKVK